MSDTKLPGIAKKISMSRAWDFLDERIRIGMCGTEGMGCNHYNNSFDEEPCKSCTVETDDIIKLIFMPDEIGKLPTPSNYEVE